MKLGSSLFVAVFPVLYVLVRMYGDSETQWWFAMLSSTIGVAHCLIARTLLSTALVLGVLTILEVYADGAELVRWYPVLVNASLCIIFFGSLWFKESIIERIAGMYRPLPPEGRRYCRVVTVVWGCFFILNGSIALYTVLIDDLYLWGLYNGCISYILIGVVFLVEYLVRRKKMAGTQLVVCLCLLLLSSWVGRAMAEPPESLEQLIRLMRDSGERTELFVQQRTVRGLTKPFESTGDLTIIPGKRLIWNIRSPLPSKLVVTPNGIHEEVQGVASDSTGSALQEQISRVLFTIHGGNYEDLMEVFDATFEQTQTGYLATLRPKQGDIKSIINDIELSGICHPQGVRIHFRGGNQLHVSFPEVSTDCSL